MSVTPAVTVTVTVFIKYYLHRKLLLESLLLYLTLSGQIDHLTAEMLMYLFACEIVSESFYHISQKECYAVKIRLLHYDTNYH